MIHRLSWRKQPSDGGLCRIGQAPRGAILKVSGKDVGHISAKSTGWGEWRGWYWFAHGEGIAMCNMAHKPVETIEEAMLIRLSPNQGGVV
jgi:hypothetical protein